MPSIKSILDNPVVSEFFINFKFYSSESLPQNKNTLAGVYDDHCIIGGCQCVIVVIVVSITPLSAPLILNYLVGPGLVSPSLVSCHTLLSYIPSKQSTT